MMSVESGIATNDGSDAAGLHLSQVITESIESQPGIMSGQVSKVLRNNLHGNLAPLLLMTASGLRRMNGIGKSREMFIHEVLEEAGLRLRLEEERVHARARSLFGSIEDTPVQALLVISVISGASTVEFYMNSPVVGLISRLTPDMTIGEIKAHSRTQQSLSDYFSRQGVEIDSRRIRDKFDELSSRLNPWFPHVTTA